MSNIRVGKAAQTAPGLISSEKYDQSLTSTFTWNGSGGTSGASTIRAAREGRSVTIHINGPQATTGTSSTSFTSNTALPTWARPFGNSSSYVVAILDNGTTSAGLLTIDTAGVITIAKFGGVSFTNTATAGLAVNFDVAYVVPA